MFPAIFSAVFPTRTSGAEICIARSTATTTIRLPIAATPIRTATNSSSADSSISSV